MKLIKCPDCGREGVSAQAVACPGCGRPIAAGAPPPVSPTNQAVTINVGQHGSARGKCLQALGALLTIGGVLVGLSAIVAAGPGDNTAAGLLMIAGILGFVGGLVLFIVGRILG